MTKSREPVEEAEEAKEIPDQNMNNSPQVSEDIEIESVRGECSDSGRGSITELYCDDEFSPSLPDHNIHLSLSHLHYRDDDLFSDKVLLPFSLPGVLQDSLQETSLDWCEVNHL